jgi:hypothetical protein
MNREKAREILGENATEEQITNLLNQWHIDESAKVKDLESKVNNLTTENSKYSDYESIKQQLDNINKANMTEQEKLEQMKKEAETNLKNSRIIVNTAKAKDILAGLNVSDSLIAKLVSDDETTTINSANELKTMLETQKEEVAKQTKESLITQNIQPTISNVPQTSDAMTMSKFMELSAEEQNAFINEHPTEFENLK